MKSTANFHIESSTIGPLLPTGNQPESSGAVLCYEFGVAAAKPLRGGKPLAALIRRLESDPKMASRFAQARRALGEVLAPHANSFRALRLAAGLSQANLAERAGATQSYVARIEAGKLDPGTDMLSRMADALGIPAVRVFEAVRAQRGRQHG